MTTSVAASSGGDPTPDHEWTLFAVDSPASRSARLVESSRKRTTGGCGRPWPGSSGISGQHGSSGRTCPVCSSEGSVTLSETLVGWGTGSGWEKSQLVQWVPHTHDPGCSFWLTPVASDATKGALSLRPSGVASMDRRRQRGGGAESERPGWWTSEPDLARVAYGVPGGVDRRRALGNAVVPQVAEQIGRMVVNARSVSMS